MALETATEYQTRYSSSIHHTILSSNLNMEGAGSTNKKGKGNITPVHAVKTYTVRRGKAPLVLNFCNGRSVVSGVVPVGNESWMLFREGRSSNLGLSRGVWQVVTLGAGSTTVYCGQKWNWTRRRALWKTKVDPAVREYVLTGRCLRKDWLTGKLGATLVGRELCIKWGWLPVQSPHGLDRCAAPDRSSWHTITRCTTARAQFELHQS